MKEDWFATEGSPSPLGVTWIAGEEAFNFALYSKHATAATLLLYAARDLVHPCHRVAFDPITNKSGRVWHCRIRTREMPEAKYYAYLVAGPNTPGEGHRFDNEKILFDPYAWALFFPPQFSRETARIPGSEPPLPPQASPALDNPTGQRSARVHTRPLPSGGYVADASSRPDSSRANLVDVESTVCSAGGLGLRRARLDVATSRREQQRTVTGRAWRSRQAQGSLSRLVTSARRFVATTHLASPHDPGRWGSSGCEGTTTSRFRWRTRWLRPTRPPQT